MFGALIKAFTGRAGLLAGLLALLIVALTAYTAYTLTPHIEQKLMSSAQDVIQSNLGDGDSFTQLTADGRNLQVSGQFQDAAALQVKLLALEGVRGVVVNNDAAAVVAIKKVVDAAVSNQVSVVSQEIALSDSPTPTENTESQTGELESQVAEEASSAEIAVVPMSDASSASTVSTEKTSQVEPEQDSAPAAVNLQSDAQEIPSEVTDHESATQSSLSLRYDGVKLTLSGHLADDQMAQLISDEVRHAIPRNSEFETSVDGEGGASPLNWMNRFLAAVANLPDDAQGMIVGSDKNGVQIVPDEEQTLLINTDSATADNSSAFEPPARSTQTQSLPAETQTAVEAPSDPADATATPAPPLEATISESAKDSEIATATTNTQTDADDIKLVQQSQALSSEQSQNPAGESPEDFIVSLNKRLAQQSIFESGQIAVIGLLAEELDQLAVMMHNHPSLFLRIVGNLDFSMGARDAEYVGVDRGRSIRDYLRALGVESFRVFSTPLPRDYAFDKQIQVVFYITE